MSEQPRRERGTGKVRPAEEPIAALGRHAPWMPVTVDPAIVSGLQAMARGDCPPHLQQKVLQWVIDTSRNGGALYFPGEAGRRDTDYALGRAFLGETIVTFLRMTLRRNSENG